MSPTRLTVSQCRQMIRAGVLMDGAPVELIDCLLVRKDRSAAGMDVTSYHPHHAYVVSQISQLAPRLWPLGLDVHTQLPITLSTYNEPEPDGAIINGTRAAFGDRHPGPADILAVMEAAINSLGFDRTTKQRLYAEAEIGIYWIINLVDQQIEVYSQPVAAEGRYAQRTDYHVGQTIVLPLSGDARLEVAVADVLPPMSAQSAAEE